MLRFISFFNRRFFISILTISIFGQFCSEAKAFRYDSVNFNIEDLEMIIDPKIEAAFRLELVNKAQSSIDIVTYDQRADDVAGMPLLKAIRQAAERGVQVRFLTSFSARTIKDPWEHVGRYLWSAPPGTPLQFFIVGGPDMEHYGWNAFHGIHEKLFIVDGKWTIVTGRGHGEEYLHWVDTAFVFKAPGLVQQSVSAYESLWYILSQEKFIVPTASGNTLFDDTDPNHRETSDLASWVAPLHLDSQQTQTVARLSQWIEQPSQIPTANSPDALSGRLLHFDLLAQLRSLADSEKREPNDFSSQERIDVLDDPIAKALIALSQDPNTHDLSFYTLAVTQTSPVQEALTQAAQRGVHVQIFTNSKEAHSSISPLGIPFGWYLGLKDMAHLLDHQINIFGYLKKDSSSPQFVHRKVAVSGDTVIFGSHNFNYASATESDEISFEIKGAAFANKIHALLNTNITEHSEKLEYEKISQEDQHSTFAEWISSMFRGFY